MFTTLTRVMRPSFLLDDDGALAGGEPAGADDVDLGAGGPTGALGEPAGAPTGEEADPFAEWGGRHRVDDAFVIARAFETEEGRKAVAKSVLTGFGLTPEQVDAVLAGQAAAEAPEAQGLDALADDDVLTVADAKRLVEDALKQRLAPLESQEEERRVAAAHSMVDNTLDALKIEKGSEEARVVLVAAQQYLGKDDWDPNHIREAITRGHADVVAMVTKTHEKYVGGKRETKETLPTHIGSTGAGGAGGSADEGPKSLDDAIRRVRESFASGAL